MRKDLYNLAYITGLISFPIIFMAVTPFVHEMWHTLFLKIYSCSYSSVFYFSVINGLKGITTYSCQLKDLQFIALKLAGAFGNIFLGLLFYLIGWKIARKNLLSPSILITIFGIAFILYSSFSFINKEADLLDLLDLYKLGKFSNLLPFFGVLTSISSIFIFWKIFKYESEAKTFHENIEKVMNSTKSLKLK